MLSSVLFNRITFLGTFFEFFFFTTCGRLKPSSEPQMDEVDEADDVDEVDEVDEVDLTVDLTSESVKFI